jgi:hypothetical protein
MCLVNLMRVSRHDALYGFNRPAGSCDRTFDATI